MKNFQEEDFLIKEALDTNSEIDRVEGLRKHIELMANSQELTNALCVKINRALRYARICGSMERMLLEDKYSRLSIGYLLLQQQKLESKANLRITEVLERIGL